MSQSDSSGTEQVMTSKELETLARKNVDKFLGVFLENVVLVSERAKDAVSELADCRCEEETACGINDPDTYRYFTNEDKYLGIHIEEYDSEGGGEGEGDHAEIVFAVLKDEEVITYFRITGFYSSYSGTEWNEEVEEVAPREVLVTKWFATDGTDD